MVTPCTSRLTLYGSKLTKFLQISDSLFEDLRSLIIEARQDVARQVNSALVLLYWRMGQRIRKDILKEKRADYGEEIVATLSQQLGWSHFKEIIPLDDDLKRDFYAEMCRMERWSQIATLKRGQYRQELRTSPRFLKNLRNSVK